MILLGILHNMFLDYLKAENFIFNYEMENDTLYFDSTYRTDIGDIFNSFIDEIGFFQNYSYYYHNDTDFYYLNHYEAYNFDWGYVLSEMESAKIISNGLKSYLQQIDDLISNIDTTSSLEIQTEEFISEMITLEGNVQNDGGIEEFEKIIFLSVASIYRHSYAYYVSCLYYDNDPYSIIDLDIFEPASQIVVADFKKVGKADGIGSATGLVGAVIRNGVLTIAGAATGGIVMIVALTCATSGAASAGELIRQFEKGEAFMVAGGPDLTLIQFP